MACGITTPWDCPGAVLGGAANAIGGDFIKTAASDAASAADSLLKTLATAWTQVPTPTAANCGGNAAGVYSCGSASGGNAGAVQFIQGDLKFITLFVGVAAIIFAAGRMAYLRRGEPVREAMGGLFRLVLVSGAGLAFLSILAQAGDAFSSYVLSSTPGSQSGDLAQATTLFKLSGGGLPSTTVPFLLLILGILAILATLIQLFLIVIRGALLVVMAGVWPLSASASMTGAGQSMFKKTTGYLLAFLLYKPAAAIVYALAFYLIQNPPAGADPTVTQIEGVVLILLATLTLPALLKFVVPAVASAGGVGAAEAIGAGAALATGAAAILATGGGAGAAGAAGKAGSSAAGSQSAGTGPAGPPGAALGGGGGSGNGGGGMPGGPPPGGPPTGGEPEGGSPDGGGVGSVREMALSGVGGSGGASGASGADGSPVAGSGSAGTAPAPSGSGEGRGTAGRAGGAQQLGQGIATATTTATGALERQMGGDGDE